MEITRSVLVLITVFAVLLLLSGGLALARFSGIDTTESVITDVSSWDKHVTYSRPLPSLGRPIRDLYWRNAEDTFDHSTGWLEVVWVDEADDGEHTFHLVFPSKPGHPYMPDSYQGRVITYTDFAETDGYVQDFISAYDAQKLLVIS